MDLSGSGSIPLTEGDALLLVDIQNDFLPGGNLPVPSGDEIIPTVNRYIAVFRDRGAPVFATRDCHPKGHCSFRDRGGPWPVHCVYGTFGFQFPPGLELPASAFVLCKAKSPLKDAYSGFDGTDLRARLRDLDAGRLFVAGLATEYCVLSTVMDGLDLGFGVVLLLDAVRAVDVNRGDGEKAIRKMVLAGAVTAVLADIS